MKGRRLERILLFIAVCISLLLWVSQQAPTWRASSRNPSTGSNAASGVSVFYELKNALGRKDSAQSLKRAFFKLEDLKNLSTVFLLSPKRTLSASEFTILKEWVEKGGRLVLSFQDEATLKKLEPFLKDSGIIAHIGPAPDFKQGKSVEAKAVTSHSFFRGGETYHFYSVLRFQDHDCFIDTADCYVREGILGKGGVVAIAGLPPFSNALIDRGDNSKLAARFALATGPSGFSDYHLLETEKTFRDLITDPAVFSPGLGLLIGVLLFFFVGGGDFETERLKAKKRAPARSFHSLNRQLLATTLNEKGGLAAAGWKQAQLLKRILGASASDKDKKEIETLSDELRPARAPLRDPAAARAVYRLIEFHQNWLKSRGRS